jgi:carboxyl-terminal processing protease
LRRVSWILGLAVAVVGAFALGLAAVGGRTNDAHRTPSVVAQVRAELAAHYYRQVPPQVLRMTDVHAMLDALQDPYTQFLDPAEFRLLRRETTGSYSGVGVTLLPGQEGLLVTRTEPGPARVAGIRPGDTILSIDGITATQLSYEQALGRILGEPGSKVTLRVRRGGHTLLFQLVRTRFSVRPVHARMVASGGRKVGLLRVDAFSQGTAPLVAKAVRRLEREHADDLVLDLRGNPGGLLDQAVATASVFLDRGVVISLSGAHEPAHVYRASSRTATRLPLVVLIDRGSASAAEVVAAALHDNARATLVGDRTFGKGLVQAVQPLTAGAALKLTVARYLTPGGADLSRGGIRPDLWAPDDPSTSKDEGLAVALLGFVIRS